MEMTALPTASSGSHRAMLDSLTAGGAILMNAAATHDGKNRYH